MPTPTLGHVWLAGPPAVAALIGGFMPAESIDLWWVLLLGAAPIGTPDPVVFSPLVGPAANVQWLAQRAIAAAYSGGGLALLLALRAVILALTVGLIETAALRSGASAHQAGRAAWLALPIVLAGGALRPQLLALPLFAAILLLGGPLAGRRFVRVGVLLVAALWANLHGSFVLAPVALGLMALGAPRADAEERLRLAAIALAGPLLNPWGPEIYAAVVEVTRYNGGASGLGLEWRPLDLTSTAGLFFLLELAAAGFGLTRLPRHRRLPSAALALPLAVLAAAGGRHTVWFATAAAAPAALGLGRLGAAVAPGRATLNGLLLASLLALAAVGLVRPFFQRDQPLALETPVALAERVAASGSRRIFAFSDWGGYLAWRARPDARVYLDNRFEQHPAEVWATYRQVSLAQPGWELALAEIGADALALEPRAQAPLAAALAGSLEWDLRHADERAVLYVRR